MTGSVELYVPRAPREPAVWQAMLVDAAAAPREPIAQGDRSTDVAGRRALRKRDPELVAVPTDANGADELALQLPAVLIPADERVERSPAAAT